MVRLEADNMKCGDIVVYNGVIGKVVTDEGIFKFKPCNSDRCYYSSLDTITENDVREATHEEKIELITKEFVWGRVTKVHCVGEYQIIESVKDNGETNYHGYINYDDTNRGYCSLDSALVGCIGYKYEGENGRASSYFCKMVDMK